MTQNSFYFLRHGETDWNVEPRRCQGQLDIPLNNTGRAQAQTIQALIKGLPITKCVSSDLSRALETAQIALNSTIAIETTPLLRERYFGSLQGQFFDEIEKQVGPNGLVEDPTIETDDAMWQRWQKTSLQPNGTLFVTHGGFIRVVFNRLGWVGHKIKNVALYKVTQQQNQQWQFEVLS